MLTVERSVVINRPIEQVFTFVANFENEPQYNPSLLSMRKTSPGAIGLGTTWQEEVRLAGTHDRTVTIYEPHHTLVYQNDRRPFPVEITFRFAPVPGGTLLTASPPLRFSLAASSSWFRPFKYPARFVQAIQLRGFTCNV